MSNRVFQAIEFATKAHGGQFRKGTKIPFIVHPINVGRKLIELDAPEDLVIAGFLHDTVEDTATTLEDIDKFFGEKVATLIGFISEPDKTKPWKERKQHTLDKLKNASSEIILLECADKLDNIKDINRDYEQEADNLWSRLNASKEDQLWYYLELSKIMRVHSNQERYNSIFTEFADQVSKFNNKILELENSNRNRKNVHPKLEVLPKSFKAKL
jgi:(p)ppGpp synthase/HD superfamily hydrolase